MVALRRLAKRGQSNAPPFRGIWVEATETGPQERAKMTNQEAIWVAGVIFAAILADLLLNSGHASLFLIFKLLDLVEYLKFWE